MPILWPLVRLPDCWLVAHVLCEALPAGGLPRATRASAKREPRRANGKDVLGPTKKHANANANAIAIARAYACAYESGR